MAYDGQTIVDLDVNRPDGDAEAKSVLDDVTKEIKRVLAQTSYSWLSVQNATGGELVAGDVVALGANVLVINDTVGSFVKHVVAVQTIANAAFGFIAREGRVKTKAAGAITELHYVRKSASSKAIEDMGLTVTSLDPVPNGAIGFSLETIGGAGLCEIFLFERSSTSPTALSDHVHLLTNRSGVVFNVGEVGSPDPSNDLSVVLNDVQGSIKPFFVAFEQIPNTTVGKWVKNGIATVVTNGPVSRLHFLRKSTITRALESTGVSTTEINVPPPGSVGIALSSFGGGGAGTVKALLFGTTVALTSQSLPGVSFVTGIPNPSAPLTKRDYIILRSALYNPVTGSTIVIQDATTLTCDTGVQGRGGRDQPLAFPSNSTVHFYETWNGATRALRCSANDPFSGPTLANGETHWVYIDSIRFNSSQLSQIMTKDDRSFYLSPQNLISTANAGVIETFLATLPAFVPQNATEYEVEAYGTAEFTGNFQGTVHDFVLSIAQSVPYRRARLYVTGVSDGNTKGDGLHISADLPNTQFLSFQWLPISGFQFTYTLAVNVLNYKNPR